MLPAAAAPAMLIHFDCFYASVFEREQPALRHLPLAVQQKHIVVTCNYEARRRGLRKLQLISEAKRLCPDLVIVLGEDLTRFRNASKLLYAFLRSFSWNARCERLGFDEVFLDVTDLVDFNLPLLNHSHLAHSFFCLDKSDPAAGFPFDATAVAGYAYPPVPTAPIASLDLARSSQLRLVLASHLAQHMRLRLESELGYTATAGIATNKLLCKLVGNMHKPNSQTTLLPPFTIDGMNNDHVTSFVDDFEIGKIPGIGSKIAQKLWAHVLPAHADIDSSLVSGATQDQVRVYHVRTYPGMGPGVLEDILGGPGVTKGIGARVWGLLNGRDDAQVSQARELPRQISIEDSYGRLDTLDGVVKELRLLAKSLLTRMHTDLVEEEDEEPRQDAPGPDKVNCRRWAAHPKSLRLSTRPRPARNADGSFRRSFARISKSAPMPSFVFNLNNSVDAVVERLVSEALVPLFRQLHPERTGWNLSLINIAATNMADAASERGGIGRDIGKMFRHQDSAVKQRQVWDEPEVAETQMDMQADIKMERAVSRLLKSYTGSEDAPTPSQEADVDGNGWESEGGDQDMDADWYRCDECGAGMPLFAMGAHERWHAQSGVVCSRSIE